MTQQAVELNQAGNQLFRDNWRIVLNLLREERRVRIKTVGERDRERDRKKERGRAIQTDR